MRTVGFNGKTIEELHDLAMGIIFRKWKYVPPEDGPYGEPPVSPAMVTVRIPGFDPVKGFEYQLTHPAIDIIDAEYIATFNPETALEMLKNVRDRDDQIELAVKILDAWRDDKTDIDPISIRHALRLALGDA